MRFLRLFPAPVCKETDSNKEPKGKANGYYYYPPVVKGLGFLLLSMLLPLQVFFSILFVIDALSHRSSFFAEFKPSAFARPCITELRGCEFLALCLLPFVAKAKGPLAASIVYALTLEDVVLALVNRFWSLSTRQWANTRS